MEINKSYNPKSTESRLYEEWLAKDLFSANVNKSKKPYTIVIPPPNITGILTMGHVLNNTIQDIFIRWKRMSGYEACWIPGTDHAGIATQNVVEKDLSKQNVTKRSLGRDKFLEKVWQWKEKYGTTIIKQLKKLGCSCDWKRERFTLDEGLSNAVKEVFVRLYEENLIYKGKYIVNWCPRCTTALSDDEIDHDQQKGNLWFIRYPLEGSEESIVVATTRPETMLGDTAVAVNPGDARYKKFVGKKVLLPLVNREINIIEDEFVDPKFGTGAVKVTPAHDPDDFQLGLKHNLQQIVVIDVYGKMNENAPETYRGLDRYKCREKIVEDLKEKGFLVKIEAYENSVGHCYRCNTVIEPYLSDQWFVRMKPLAEEALRVVQNGDIKFHPERWVKVYGHWMENIRDWCISRQLWWGHRIPAYYCVKEEVEGNKIIFSGCPPIVALTKPEKCPHCGNANIIQDPDVLDTWFSSWLWPFSTLGWPEETEDLKYFYPTDTLVTAPDIIFFWVARMIMAGLKFRGNIPFKDVYFTSLVRDLQGRKMSKSLGNSPDPLDIIEDFGADSLRFTIAYLSPLGQDILFSKEKCEIGRRFCNKIWNATRFVLMNIEPGQYSLDDVDWGVMEEMDRWIITEYNLTVKNATGLLEEFEICAYSKLIYDFFWDKFCDWYLELVKPRMMSGDAQQKKIVQQILLKILPGFLKLAHPVIPFITEEIYQHLSQLTGNEGFKTSIMISDWPVCDEKRISFESKKEIDFIINIIKEIRAIRTEFNIEPRKMLELVVNAAAEENKTVFEKYSPNLKFMTKIEKIAFSKTRPDYSVVFVSGDMEIYIPLKEAIDVEKESARLQKTLEKIIEQNNGLLGKLENEQFVSRAAPQEVARVRDLKTENESKIEKLKKYMDMLK